MEIKRRFNLRHLFVIVYFVAFAMFLNHGLNFAEATNYNITGNLEIPTIGLNTDVAATGVVNYEIEVPEYIAGSFSRADNKVLLIGHSSTVFSDLNQVNLEDRIIYNNERFRVVQIDLLPKEAISMNELLSSADKSTLVLMTCAGKDLPNLDSTHRLIITAVSE